MVSKASHSPISPPRPVQERPRGKYKATNPNACGVCQEARSCCFCCLLLLLKKHISYSSQSSFSECSSDEEPSADDQGEVPHESTPQRVALPRCRPLGNQCVWIFCAHSIFPTEEARFKKSYRHKWLSRLKAWNTPNCSYLCILLLRIRHGANGQKPQETGAPQENKKHPCMFAPIFGADVDE